MVPPVAGARQKAVAVAKLAAAKPDFSLEMAHSGLVAGVDEAGRGPWAGPVVAGAVIFPDRLAAPNGIHDSKKLTPEKREALFELIHASAIVGVGIASVEEIDTLNILGATKLAMTRAVEALSTPPKAVLVDGNQPPKWFYITESVVKGDARSVSIAAASIIAKVTRDRMMQQLHEAHPQYGWAGNAGYGTPEHIHGIAAHGITAHHRRSFAPIRKVLEEADAAA